MKKKLRVKYKSLTFIMLFTYIIISVVGFLNVGDYGEVGNTMFWFGMFGAICSVFALLAFCVCLPKEDEYAFKNLNTKRIAQISAASVGAPISAVSNGFRVGPRARYIIPVLIFGALLTIGSIEMLPCFMNYESNNTNIIYLIFFISCMAEVLTIYTTITCHKYNQAKIKKENTV